MYNTQHTAMLPGLLLLLLLAACGGGAQTEQKPKLATTYKAFILSKGDARQHLQVRWLNDTAISFVLEHRQGSCNYTLSGEAVNPYLAYDPESDSDDSTGELYWVDLYLYNRGECRIALRIAQDTSRAQLQLANCAASPDCALKSLGVLRRE